MEGRARGRQWAGLGAGVLLLTVATWLYHGYRWSIWPQLGTLDHVYRYAGEFSNDFYTSVEAPQWAFAHLLGWLGPGLTEAALGVFWVLSMLVLWGSFLMICRALGADGRAGLAAGLVAVPTAFAGLGIQAGFFAFTYPSATAFALSVAGLAALLYSRNIAAGALLGLATLIHPNVGVLMTGAMAPILLIGEGPLRRRLLEFALPWLPLALPAIVVVVTSQVAGNELSTSEAFDLVTVVRGPHHYLYSAFPASEYLQVGLWGAVLALGLVSLRDEPLVRPVALVAGAVVLICIAGGIASEAGGPLPLVTALTARLTPLITFLGLAVAAAVLTRRSPLWGAAALLAVFAITPVVQGIVEDRTWYPEWGSAGAIEAVGVLLVLGFTLVAPELGRVTERERRVPAVAFAALLAVCGASLLLERAERTDYDDSDLRAFADVAREARETSTDSDVFLTPPDVDGFRALARRATVIDFGNFPFADQQAEWMERIEVVTQDPRILDPALGTNVPARVVRMADSYDRAVATSREAVCRYEVVGVVARADVPPPPWLRRVYSNGSYQLLEVRPGACGPGAA